MLADKDIASVTDLLKTTVKDWFIATLDVPRAAPIRQLHEALQGQQVHEFGSIQQAFETVLKQCHNNQLILVCGSFHTLEAIWEYLEQCQ